MSREKQIEEMARDICECYSNGTCYQDDRPCDLKCESMTDAQYLYKKGYRKQSEGEWKQADSNGTHVDGFMVCSNCDVMIPTCENNYYCLSRLYYCPRCGAKMKGGAE